MARKLSRTRNNKSIESDFKKAVDRMRTEAKKNNLLERHLMYYEKNFIKTATITVFTV